MIMVHALFFHFAFLPFHFYHITMLEKGLVQIYTGNGKGKTTAAIGLALRAAGWGKNVIIYQFLKPPALKLGERKALAKAKLPIKIEAVDVRWNLQGQRNKKTLKQVRGKIQQVCEKIRLTAKKGEYDLIILDEIIYCYSKKLVDKRTIEKIIKAKKQDTELIMTGRGAAKELFELADLVTEMKEIKHPFKKGTKAKKGIEF
jgi:cob(I)alamin adenosyltransferase